MKKILLVEDDDIQRLTFRRFLELDGYRVTDVSDGLQALKAFSEYRKFDAVVADVFMPGMDGSALIHKLLKISPDLPVVSMSAGRRVLTPEFALRSARFAGSVVQLTKPFSRNELKAAVEQAIGG